MSEHLSMAELLALECRQFRPPPRLALSDWADGYRILNAASAAEPGRWRTDRFEPMRGVMDAASDPGVSEIALMCSSQIGKTEVLLNTVGYYIDSRPAPILVVFPTEEMAKSFSKDRLALMIEDSPALRGKVKEARSRDSDNTVLHKAFIGGHITLVGANSPAGLASRPIKVVLADEIDRYPPSAGAEGDPLKLAEVRTTTFHDSKMIAVSTPTIAGASRIEALYENSSQGRWFVKCPHCDHEQTLAWAQVKWNKAEDETPLPETAAYECVECGTLWDDAQRNQAVAGGRWIHAVPEAKRKGFAVSAIASPWLRLEKLAEEYLEAQNKPELLKTFVNTRLAEVWEDRGEAPDWNRLWERRDSQRPRGTIPRDVMFLTAGVDIQKRGCIEVSIWGWGCGRRSWLIDHVVLDGNVDDPGDQVWRDLGNLIQRPWQCRETGLQMPIVKVAIDSGYSTINVYAWSRTQRGNQVMVIKGQAQGRMGSDMPLSRPKAIDFTQRGRTIRNGVYVTHVNVSNLKFETYGFLRLQRLDEAETPEGWIDLPDVDQEFCRQMVAEQLRYVADRRGGRKAEWHKVYDRNEALDCRVYARAAAYGYGYDRLSDEQLTAIGAEMRGQGQQRRSLGSMFPG